MIWYDQIWSLLSVQLKPLGRPQHPHLMGMKIFGRCLPAILNNGGTLKKNRQIPFKHNIILAHMHCLCLLYSNKYRRETIQMLILQPSIEIPNSWVWSDMICYDLIWPDMSWFDLVWSLMIWSVQLEPFGIWYVLDGPNTITNGRGMWWW